MVGPNFMHRFQEPLSFVTLLHGVLLQSGWEGWEDGFLRNAIEVLNDKVADAIVQHFSVLAYYQLVAKPVTVFKGGHGSIAVQDFTDKQAKLRPGSINIDTWAMPLLGWRR
jgi:hypothetical protein